MAKKVIVTIGREFGSGGREIGMKLAESLGIKCYDSELLSEAAKRSGFCEEIFKSHDEKPTNSFLYALVMDTYPNYGGTGQNGMSLPQQLFLAQFETIRKLASEGPCVFVGRCADYALKDNYDIVNIFITCDEKTKINRIMERENVKESKAKELMIKNDKRRSSYYNYYADKKWGICSTYDLCLNSGILGIDGTVEVIKKYIETKYN